MGGDMKFWKSLIFFLSIMVLLSLTINCAGSKNEFADDEFAPAKDDQKEMDDIEALLGIKSDNPPAQPAKTKKAKAEEDTEKLNLLDTQELAPQQENSMIAARPVEPQQETVAPAKLKELEEQVKQKDRQISNLQNTIQSQQDEINQLQKSSPKTTFATGSLSPVEYEQNYQTARSAFQNREFDSAIQMFESLIAADASNKLAENAQYWIGESYFAKRKYDAAILSFEKVTTFNGSNKKDDAQFMLGRCYVLKGNKQQGMEELNRLITDYPDSEYVPRAQKLISGL
jgi:TolA-binding protein